MCVCEGERDEETPFCICLYKICKTRAAQSFLQGGRISFSVSTKSYLPDEFEKCDLSLKLQGNINNYGRLLLLLITCNLPPQFQLLLLSPGFPQWSTPLFVFQAYLAYISVNPQTDLVHSLRKVSPELASKFSHFPLRTETVC